MLDCKHDAAEHKFIDHISANPATCQFGEETLLSHLMKLGNQFLEMLWAA